VLANEKSLELSYSFTSKVLWLSELDLSVNQKCLIRIGTLEVSACLIEITEKIDLKTQDQTDKLVLKEFQMADCIFKLDEAQYLEPLEKGDKVNFVVKLDTRIGGAGIIRG
jgi:sulfate adenylyltransferase subunit 1 (EFTu-like GTPase family)